MEVLSMDGDRISEYMKVMYNHLKDFEIEIRTMESLENDVMWDSPAAQEAKNMYKGIIKNYLEFANKLMIFIDYLEGYINGYSELVEEVKEKFKKINEEYEIEDTDEKYNN